MPQCLQAKFLWVSAEMQLLWGTDTDTLRAQLGDKAAVPCGEGQNQTAGSSEGKD